VTADLKTGLTEEDPVIEPAIDQEIATIKSVEEEAQPIETEKTRSRATTAVKTQMTNKTKISRLSRHKVAS
jgi:hypothetical protein